MPYVWSLDEIFMDSQVGPYRLAGAQGAREAREAQGAQGAQ